MNLLTGFFEDLDPQDDRLVIDVLRERESVAPLPWDCGQGVEQPWDLKGDDHV